MLVTFDESTTECYTAGECKVPVASIMELECNGSLDCGLSTDNYSPH